jgi:hypothetical protein
MPSCADAKLILDLALRSPILQLRRAAAIDQGGAPMDQIRISQRRDAHRHDIVELGIALQEQSGTLSAVEFLRSQDIPAPVIERVLGEPERRRSSTA